MDHKQGSSRTRKTAAIGVMLGLPVLAIAMSAFAQSVSKRDQTLHECARIMARYELLHRHWRVLETDREFGPVIDAMFNETLADPTDASWKVKIVNPSQSGSTDLSDFERDAFKQLESRDDDMVDFSPKRGLRYACAVRLKKSCLPCHQAPRGKPESPFKEGDLLAFVSVTREPPVGTK